VDFDNFSLPHFNHIRFADIISPACRQAGSVVPTRSVGTPSFQLYSLRECNFARRKW